MSSEFQCTCCNRPMQSSGFNGLCARCVFLCATSRQLTAEESGAASTSGLLEQGCLVGPKGRFLLLERFSNVINHEVWLADDRQLSTSGNPQLCVLKFLPDGAKSDADALAALRAHVARCQDLDHPNLCRLVELHSGGEGQPFVRMDYVEGDTLQATLDERPGRMLPWREALTLARQLATALQHAHEVMGIPLPGLHPGALLVCQGATLKVMEPGLMGVWPGAKDSTTAPGFAESRSYASPQRLQGGAPNPADDIYSAGAILFEMLGGRPPFGGETVDELLRQSTEPTSQAIPQKLQALRPEPPVPAALMALVGRCLDKDPAARPSAAGLASQLAALEQPASAPKGPKPEAPPANSAPRQIRPPFLKKIQIAAVVLGLVALWLGPKPGPRNHSPSTPLTNAVAAATNIPKPVVVAPPPAPAPPTNAPPVEAPLPGAIGIYVLRGDDEAAHSFRLSQLDEAGKQVVKDTGFRAPSALVTNKAMFESTKLPPGKYLLTVTEHPDLVVSRELTVKPDTAETVPVFFERPKLRVVAEPEDARISWERQEDHATDDYDPESKAFKPGRYAFAFSRRGYFPTNVLVQVPLTNATEVRVRLSPITYPLPGEKGFEVWTNSLGLVFHWQPALSLYAAAAETRLADFVPFVEARSLPRQRKVSSSSTNGYVDRELEWTDPGFPGYSLTREHPLIGVSWQDATNYCAWLTEQERAARKLDTKQLYRLPTFREWSALAGNTRYPWGDKIVPGQIPANYAGSEVVNSAGWPAVWPHLNAHSDPFPRTARAGRFPANAAGLFNLAGNVAEWCSDQRVAGGSWFDGEEEDYEALQTTNAPRMSPDTRTDRIGFRLILTTLGQTERALAQ